MTVDDDIDIERRLALSYVSADARARLASLWTLDTTLRGVVAGAGLAAIRQIKLVWWRDALTALDTAPPPANPVLVATAGLLGAGVAGSELARLEEPWAVLLSEDPLSGDDLADYAQRGRILFAAAARLLGGVPDDSIGRAGEAWALADLARHSRDVAEGQAALLMARDRIDRSYRWPSRLRPLGMLAMLAARDAGRGAVPPEPQGSPRRVLRMMGHRLTGR